MPEYYFDIETVPLEQYRGDVGASFDPFKAKIISIQYQKLDSGGGRLVILKEWEPRSSERAIVEQFKKVFIDKGIWEFIPVGNNLAFECRFMKYKLKQYCALDGLKLGQRPMIDLKHVLVIANNGSFKGYHRLLGKSGQAANIADWYYDRNYSAIDQYVRQEADDFVGKYSVLKELLPKISIG
ncbi:MAG: hypothetical protein ACREAZ_05235 [Nitrososphaera sp.]